ncbi:hypothetical protein Q428_03405 [Fervidicella metallireducens AeB]|uniref:Uncharacterized protein n=1 Tax=Fervidicella metallireducens AeB TaxID=1403537 RepID=A0A017RXB3_9CLOT|nr:hypothetical protein [Fervidicella metallireducens]EYE89337.1 hypothetical protein Q428_03405 [Fervidicella metallireducens AeB]
MRDEVYIGFKLNEVVSEIEKDNKRYEIIEIWDTKKTKIGDDLRIVNIKNDDIIKIYVAYF